ncbi:hypothetical protein P7C70_g6687, partial [Phenoliferia sp. Uapishka_3]
PVVVEAPAPPVATPVATPPAAPLSAPTPKTWASLAASNKAGWGTGLAGVSGVSTRAPPPAANSTATPTPAASSSRAGQKEGNAARPPYPPAVMEVTQPGCFVKGVLETVSESNLRAHLEGKFGALRELDIIRSKACAFLEFERLDGARRAILASLRPSEGGEGGIFVPSENGGDMIHIVTRKPPGDRPPSNPRGRGGGVGGDDRGGRTGYGNRTGQPGSGTGGYKGGNAPTEDGARGSAGGTRGGAKSGGGRGRGNSNGGTSGASTRGGAAK